jgi:cob(I)alamin adenosyltransferase
LGLARAEGVDAEINGMLEQLQRDLFAVGSMLADPRHKVAARVEKALLGAPDIARLEGWIDTLESGLAPLRRFILAGGSRAGGSLHLARTVCRRAERRIISLGSDAVDPVVIVFINRWSDLLFVMARSVNARASVPETEWLPREPRGNGRGVRHVPEAGARALREFSGGLLADAAVGTSTHCRNLRVRPHRG